MRTICTACLKYIHRYLLFLNKGGGGRARDVERRREGVKVAALVVDGWEGRVG